MGARCYTICRCVSGGVPICLVMTVTSREWISRMRLPRQRWTHLIERVAARIPNSLSITGNINSTENVQVDGELKGDLVCKGLVIISETSQVTGNIVAEEALITGRVLGFIRADRVRLCATSHVEGDISYQTFRVEPGAYFKGKWIA